MTERYQSVTDIKRDLSYVLEGVSFSVQRVPFIRCSKPSVAGHIVLPLTIFILRLSKFAVFALSITKNDGHTGINVTAVQFRKA